MRKTTLAATLLTAAVLLTGCGTDKPDTQVASGTGAQQPEATATSAPPSLSRDEMAIKFTQCLREQGLNVPDPEPGKEPSVDTIITLSLLHIVKIEPIKDGAKSQNSNGKHD